MVPNHRGVCADAALQQKKGRTIRDWWLKHNQLVLTITSVVFIIAFGLPIIFPDLPAPWPAICDLMMWLTWAVFIADYALSLAASKHPRRFIKRNWVKLLIVILPAFQILRLLSLLPLLRFLNNSVGANWRSQVVTYVSLGIAILTLFCSLLTLRFERASEDANITTFGESLWWAFSTMTTVGYGDYSPVTTAGRLCATVLMFGSFVLLATATATAAISSWMLQQLQTPVLPA